MFFLECTIAQPKLRAGEPLTSPRPTLSTHRFLQHTARRQRLMEMEDDDE